MRTKMAKKEKWAKLRQTWFIHGFNILYTDTTSISKITLIIIININTIKNH